MIYIYTILIYMIYDIIYIILIYIYTRIHAYTI